MDNARRDDERLKIALVALAEAFDAAPAKASLRDSETYTIPATEWWLLAQSIRRLIVR